MLPLSFEEPIEGQQEIPVMPGGITYTSPSHMFEITPGGLIDTFKVRMDLPQVVITECQICVKLEGNLSYIGVQQAFCRPRNEDKEICQPPPPPEPPEDPPPEPYPGEPPEEPPEPPEPPDPPDCPPPENWERYWIRVYETGFRKLLIRKNGEKVDGLSWTHVEFTLTPEGDDAGFEHITEHQTYDEPVLVYENYFNTAEVFTGFTTNNYEHYHDEGTQDVKYWSGGEVLGSYDWEVYHIKNDLWIEYEFLTFSPNPYIEEEVIDRNPYDAKVITMNAAKLNQVGDPFMYSETHLEYKIKYINANTGEEVECDGGLTPPPDDDDDYEPPPPPPPRDDEDDNMDCCSQSQCRDIEDMLRKVVKNGGFNEYPAELPKSLVGDDVNKNVKINSLSEMVLWFIQQYDALTGQYPIDIEIEDIDPSKEGNQKRKISLPNMAEAIGEIYSLVLKSGVDSDIHTRFLMRLAAESVANKNISAITQSYAKANALFLGYKATPKAYDMRYAFNANELGKLEDILEDSEGEIEGWSNEDENTAIEYFQRLMFAASIIKSKFFKPAGVVSHVLNEVNRLAGGSEEDKEKAQKLWENFLKTLSDRNHPKPDIKWD